MGYGAGVQLFGWDDDAKVWVKLLVDEDGKLRISDADPFEIIQGTPADLKHSPQTYDPTTPAWRALASNALGHLLVQIASLASLGDIDDVTIAALADGHFISWSEGLGYWQNRLLAEADIPAAIARDAEVAAAVAAKDVGEGHILILPINYDSIGAGTWALGADASALFAFSWLNTSAADLDNISFKAYLQAGTYTLRVNHRKAADLGIMDIDINDTEVASFDMYDAGTLHNQVSTQINISIATSGLYTIKARVHGQNASSTGYTVIFSYLALWRTA